MADAVRYRESYEGAIGAIGKEAGGRAMPQAEINRLLVPFGKYICTGRLPKCSTCPVLAWCRQVGVTKHR